MPPHDCIGTYHVKLKNGLRATFLRKTHIALQGRCDGHRRVSGGQWDVFWQYFSCTPTYLAVWQRADWLTLKCSLLLKTPYKRLIRPNLTCSEAPEWRGRLEIGHPALFSTQNPPVAILSRLEPGPNGRSGRTWAPPPICLGKWRGGSPIFRFIM